MPRAPSDSCLCGTGARYGLARFRVFVGDPTRHPRILRRSATSPAIRPRRSIPSCSTRTRSPACFGRVESIASRDDVDFQSTTLSRVDRLRLARVARSSWGVYEDVGDAGRFLETFTVESWLELMHLRERVSNADEIIINRVRHLLAEAPRITLSVSSERPHRTWKSMAARVTVTPELRCPPSRPERQLHVNSGRLRPQQCADADAGAPLDAGPGCSPSRRLRVSELVRSAPGCPPSADAARRLSRGPGPGGRQFDPCPGGSRRELCWNLLTRLRAA